MQTNHELYQLFHQFLSHNSLHKTAHMLEAESKIYFDVDYFNSLIIGSEVDKAIDYYNEFTKNNSTPLTKSSLLLLYKFQFYYLLSRNKKNSASVVLTENLKSLLSEPSKQTYYQLACLLAEGKESEEVKEWKLNFKTELETLLNNLKKNILSDTTINTEKKGFSHDRIVTLVKQSCEYQLMKYDAHLLNPKPEVKSLLSDYEPSDEEKKKIETKTGEKLNTKPDKQINLKSVKTDDESDSEESSETVDYEKYFNDREKEEDKDGEDTDMEVETGKNQTKSGRKKKQREEQKKKEEKEEKEKQKVDSKKKGEDKKKVEEKKKKIETSSEDDLSATLPTHVITRVKLNNVEPIVCAFHPKNKNILLVGARMMNNTKNLILVVNIFSQEQSKYFLSPNQIPEIIKWWPDGQLFAVTFANDNHFGIFEFKQNEKVGVVTPKYTDGGDHEKPITSIFSDKVSIYNNTEKRKILITGSQDGTCKVWDVLQKQCIYILKPNQKVLYPITAVFQTVLEAYYIFTTTTEKPQLYSYLIKKVNPKELPLTIHPDATLTCPLGSCSDMYVEEDESGESRFFTCGSTPNSLIELDIYNSKHIKQTFRGYDNKNKAPLKLVFSESAKWIGVADGDSIKYWSINNTKLAKTLWVDDDIIKHITCTSTGDLLAATIKNKRKIIIYGTPAAIREYETGKEKKVSGESDIENSNLKKRKRNDVSESSGEEKGKDKGKKTNIKKRKVNKEPEPSVEDESSMDTRQQSPELYDEGVNDESGQDKDEHEGMEESSVENEKKEKGDEKKRDSRDEKEKEKESEMEVVDKSNESKEVKKTAEEKKDETKKDENQSKKEEKSNQKGDEKERIVEQLVKKTEIIEIEETQLYPLDSQHATQTAKKNEKQAKSDAREVIDLIDKSDDSIEKPKQAASVAEQEDAMEVDLPNEPKLASDVEVITEEVNADEQSETQETSNRTQEASNKIQQEGGINKGNAILTFELKQDKTKLLSSNALKEKIETTNIIFGHKGNLVLSLDTKGISKLWKWEDKGGCSISTQEKLITPNVVAIPKFDKNEFHDKFVPSILELAKNDSFLVVSYGGKLHLFNTAKRLAITVLHEPLTVDEVPCAFSFEPKDNNFFAIGLYSGHVRCKQLRQKTVISLTCHSAPISDLKLVNVNEERWLITAASDRTVKIWKFTGTDYEQKHEFSVKISDEFSEVVDNEVPKTWTSLHLEPKSSEVKELRLIRFMVKHSSFIEVYNLAGESVCKWSPGNHLCIRDAAYNCTGEFLYILTSDNNINVLAHNQDSQLVTKSLFTFNLNATYTFTTITSSPQTRDLIGVGTTSGQILMAKLGEENLEKLL